MSLGIRILSLAAVRFKMTGHVTLKTQALRDFASSQSCDRLSVIVEAKRAAMSSERIAATRELGRAPVPSARKTRGSQSPSTVTSQLFALEAFLNGIGLRGKARILEAAGSLVVEVTPLQLRQLAAAPCVQGIRPNQLRRRLQEQRLNLESKPSESIATR